MRASRESSRRSLGTDDSLDSSVGSEPERSLSQRSTMLYLPAKFTVPPPTLPFGLNSLSCAAALNTRNNSVNSIQSSSNSSTLSSTDKVIEMTVSKILFPTFLVFVCRSQPNVKL